MSNEINNYIVAFVGLPSGGKSTIINSLLGKRILQSGTCRTTTELNELSNEIIHDDNGNKFIAIDFAGICDSEETNTNFNEITYAHITRANLICFVSDVNKAFITTHEVNEYNKIKKIIKDTERETGTIYDIAIILSKCDFDANHKNTKKKNTKSTITEEIEDSDEDTDLCDLIDKIRTKLPNDDIILFNAFGRIMHHNDISPSLKKIVAKSYVSPSDHNITFSIDKYIKNTQANQEKSYENKFCENMELYINNPNVTLNSIKTSFNTMYEINQHKFFKKYIDGEIVHKQYDFIEYVLSVKPEFYDKYTHDVEYYRFRYYVRAVNMNGWNNGIMTEQCKNTHNLIAKSFEKLNDETQITTMDSIMFHGEIFIKNMDSVMFLENCFMQTGGFDKYDFEKKFNEFITTCDPKKFTIMYDILIDFTPKKMLSASIKNIDNEYLYTETVNVCKTCNKETYGVISSACKRCGQFNLDTQRGIQSIEQKYGKESCITGKGLPYSIKTTDIENIEIIINKFLNDLHDMVNDKLYILYNKLEILKTLIIYSRLNGVVTSDNYNHHFYNYYVSLVNRRDRFFEQIEKIDTTGNKIKCVSKKINNYRCGHHGDNSIIDNPYFVGENNLRYMRKLENHPKYIEIVKEFYDKLLGDDVIPYVNAADIQFMSPVEVLYKE